MVMSNLFNRVLTSDNGGLLPGDEFVNMTYYSKISNSGTFTGEGITQALLYGRTEYGAFTVTTGNEMVWVFDMFEKRTVKSWMLDHGTFSLAGTQATITVDYSNDNSTWTNDMTYNYTGTGARTNHTHTGGDFKARYVRFKFDHAGGVNSFQTDLYLFQIYV